MDFYIDLLLQEDEEVPIYFIRNKVFTKFHKALCDLESTKIGVSFPRYKVMLGDVIRIHGAKVELEALQATDWLGGLIGYCKVSAIQAIPNDVTYRTISRKQANMTEAKLRRLITRDSIAKGEVKQYKVKMFTQGLDNPYFELKSTSNNHLYRRYIAFGTLHAQKKYGEFDSFGLSKIATIPWF